jgi:hypothetical protein
MAAVFGHRKNPFQAWELTSLEGLMFKAVDIQGGGASMWSIFPTAAILLAQAQPNPPEQWCFERGQNGAQLCEPTEAACNALLKITRRSQQVRAYKSSRGWNIQARRHRLTRQATQTVIFGADFKRAIKEASSGLTFAR